MEQRVFYSRIEALRREVMAACKLDMLIAYSDSILTAGAVRYLTDFDMYAMFGLAIVPRQGDVALAFGLHHSAYRVRVTQTSIANYFLGTYHPGELCAELLAETHPQTTPRVGIVGGAHMFHLIDEDLRAKLGGVTFIDVDAEFWRHYFASVESNGSLANLKRSAAIGCAALDHARSLFEGGQRSAAQIGASATLVARRRGADILNRELIQVLCASGMPIPAHLSPSLHQLPALNRAVAMEILPCFGGQRTVCGRTFLAADAGAEAVREVERAAEVHGAILDLLQVGATGRQILEKAHQLGTKASLGLCKTGELGHCIGLEIRQNPVLVEGDTTALAVGMTFAIRTRLNSKQLGTVHRADTVRITAKGPEVLTVGC